MPFVVPDGKWIGPKLEETSNCGFCRIGKMKQIVMHGGWTRNYTQLQSRLGEVHAECPNIISLSRQLPRRWRWHHLRRSRSLWHISFSADDDLSCISWRLAYILIVECHAETRGIPIKRFCNLKPARCGFVQLQFQLFLIAV
jgi:hypothetical protein